MAPCAKAASKVTHPKQRANPHPMLQRRGAEQDRRRQVFLTKVKQSGEDRRWDSRADQVPHTLHVRYRGLMVRKQILRNDFLSRKKQWEIEQARSAPPGPVAPEDEEMEVGIEPGSRPGDALVLHTTRSAVSRGILGAGTVDKVLSQAEEELEALISLVEEAARPTDDQGILLNEYGSEDEDYDGLFMRLVSEVEGGDELTNVFSAPMRDPGQEMDTSTD